MKIKHPFRKLLCRTLFSCVLGLVSSAGAGDLNKVITSNYSQSRVFIQNTKTTHNSEANVHTYDVKVEPGHSARISIQVNSGGSGVSCTGSLRVYFGNSLTALYEGGSIEKTYTSDVKVQLGPYLTSVSYTSFALTYYYSITVTYDGGGGGGGEPVYMMGYANGGHWQQMGGSGFGTLTWSDVREWLPNFSQGDVKTSIALCFTSGVRYPAEFIGNGNGVSAFTSDISTKTYYRVIRSGYEFDGWWTAASGGRQITSSDIVSKSTTALYAHWKSAPRPTYTIKFVKNEGSGQVVSKVFESGVKTRLPAIKNGLKWERRGYKFKGWATSTAKARAGTVWKADWANVSQAIGSGKTLTVYAIWELKPGCYEIKFNKNDGSGKWRTVAYEYGVKTRIPTVRNGLEWTVPGSAFRYWALSARGAEWKDDWAYVSTPVRAGATLNAYAIWR